ncbi:dihydropteroate synthase [Spirulina sp. CS-785/01]|uniref:dihydropteroate synthase n=1 Tax=Spirulina sp. CS-785/01 TaxID=3021716 RepID=UPI00232BAD72|nr:dihydropteroate synthase [Spirulina sp. CS-785/01]MDB9315031.1 dihydropteroate synthase [Spirulina sp. CS-785/01]
MSNLFAWGQRTYIMGILNVTPDSFSDGGEFNTVEAALVQAKAMVEGGADILDIGGQSTRPGAEQIPLEEELKRTIPVIKEIRQEMTIPLSIDTTRAEVAQAALDAGANVINDISGGQYEPQILQVAADAAVPYILMHIRGTPQTMQQRTDYQDVVAEIYQYFEQQIRRAVEVGVARSQIILDPGIGFAKTYEQNLEILRRLPEFKPLNCPLLIGVSRKSFIGHLLNQPDPKKRVWGTAGACASAIAKGADILRVHDVPPLFDVAQVTDAIFR